MDGISRNQYESPVDNHAVDVDDSTLARRLARWDRGSTLSTEAIFRAMPWSRATRPGRASCTRSTSSTVERPISALMWSSLSTDPAAGPERARPRFQRRRVIILAAAARKMLAEEHSSAAGNRHGRWRGRRPTKSGDRLASLRRQRTVEVQRLRRRSVLPRRSPLPSELGRPLRHGELLASRPDSFQRVANLNDVRQGDLVSINRRGDSGHVGDGHRRRPATQMERSERSRHWGHTNMAWGKERRPPHRWSTPHGKRQARWAPAASPSTAKRFTCCGQWRRRFPRRPDSHQRPGQRMMPGMRRMVLIAGVAVLTLRGVVAQAGPASRWGARPSVPSRRSRWSCMVPKAREGGAPTRARERAMARARVTATFYGTPGRRSATAALLLSGRADLAAGGKARASAGDCLRRPTDRNTDVALRGGGPADRRQS